MTKAINSSDISYIIVSGLIYRKWVSKHGGVYVPVSEMTPANPYLKETFRAFDIIARLGGDEFSALAIDITEANAEIFTARLQSLIDTRNNKEDRRYEISISVGCSCYNPENPCSLDELIASADKLMYEQKQNKRSLLLKGASLSNGNHPLNPKQSSADS